MRRQAIIGAVVLVGVAVVLGATVFRTDIAQATGLAQSVTVDNTTTNPVPVREQNIDGNGNIKVHEKGTASVDATSVPAQAAFRHALHLGECFTVPDGKRLVIEEVSGAALVASTENTTWRLRVSGSDATFYYFFGADGGPVANPPTGYYLFFSEPTTIYADSGQSVCATVYGPFFFSADTNVSGYTVAMP